MSLVVLAPLFSVVVVPAAAVYGWPDFKLRMACDDKPWSIPTQTMKCDNGETWGVPVKFGNEHVSLKDCYGLAFYGRGIEGVDSSWNFANAYGDAESCCGWWCNQWNNVDPASGYWDKGCFCQTLECPGGVKPYRDQLDNKVKCPPRKPSPTHMEISFDLIYSNQGGSSGQMEKKTTKSIGSTFSGSITRSDSIDIASKVETSMSETSIVDTITDTAELDASMASTFASSMSSTWEMKHTEQTDYSFDVWIDLSKPCYWYRTVIRVSSADDVLVTMLGNAQLFQDTPVKVPSVTIPLTTGLEFFSSNATLLV